ncbi:hypothetical protein RFI_33633, partial [Reticulomyxa filosa]
QRSKKKANAADDRFYKWCLQQRINKLSNYVVPPVNTRNIPKDFEFKPSGMFPTFQSDLFTEPRRDEQQEKQDQKKLKIHVDFTDDVSMSSINSKLKSIDERAKQDLLQVYGCWFAARVASLDFVADLDWASSATETIAKSILDVLYRMADPKACHDVPLKPDEFIYKSCLILCGKLKRAN